METPIEPTNQMEQEIRRIISKMPISINIEKASITIILRDENVGFGKLVADKSGGIKNQKIPKTKGMSTRLEDAIKEYKRIYTGEKVERGRLKQEHSWIYTQFWDKGLLDTFCLLKTTPYKYPHVGVKANSQTEDIQQKEVTDKIDEATHLKEVEWKDYLAKNTRVVSYNELADKFKSIFGYDLTDKKVIV